MLLANIFKFWFGYIKDSLFIFVNVMMAATCLQCFTDYGFCLLPKTASVYKSANNMAIILINVKSFSYET